MSPLDLARKWVQGKGMQGQHRKETCADWQRKRASVQTTSAVHGDWTVCSPGARGLRPREKRGVQRISISFISRALILLAIIAARLSYSQGSEGDHNFPLVFVHWPEEGHTFGSGSGILCSYTTRNFDCPREGHIGVLINGIPIGNYTPASMDFEVCVYVGACMHVHLRESERVEFRGFVRARACVWYLADGGSLQAQKFGWTKLSGR